MAAPEFPQTFVSEFQPGNPDLDYCEAPDEFLEGNRLVLLHDGREAYPSMLSAIAEAKKTVYLETYILRSDKTGWEFAHALARRARAGVKVRVIFDSIGSLGISEEFLQFLRNHGILFLEYHPVAPWRRRWGWGRRDHRKILVVDSRIGFTGGINIADDYADTKTGKMGWRDIDVRIEGPASHELDRLFRATWFRETGKWFKLEGQAEPFAKSSFVRITANQEFLHRHRIRRAYRYALRHAQRTLDIVNPYFIPDRRIRRALYRASQRGIRVRILVPGKSDVATAAYASRCRFEDHLRHGIRIFEWPGPVLHAKIVVVDGIWSAVGSYNMDHRSWLHNLEVNLHILDRKFSEELQASVEKDIAKSPEITLAQWDRRPPQNRILERFCYLFRYWL